MQGKAKGVDSESIEKLVTCDNCSSKYSKSYRACPHCGSDRVRPDFIVKKEKLDGTWRFNIALLKSYKNPLDLIIGLSRLGPKGDGTWGFHSISIKTPEEMFNLLEWMEVFAVDAGWRDVEEHIEEIKKKEDQGFKVDKELEELIQQHPRIVPEILKKLDFDSMDEDNIEYVNDLIKILQNTIFGAESRVKTSFIDLIQRLSLQDKKGFDELSNLLQSWDLLQITAVSHILLNRLNDLEIMEKLITEEKTYELQGDKSIHRFLEKSLWMIEETYWLAQSNESIRKFIGDELAKKDKVTRKRPDFVCCEFGNEIIIVEIKRPSQIIGKKELDQIEQYEYIMSKYKSQKYKIATILIGNKFSDEAKYLSRKRKLRIMAYNELLQKNKKKYQEYLKTLETRKTKIKN